jgi:peptide-methionine (S)-S-oxide reductase
MPRDSRITATLRAGLGLALLLATSASVSSKPTSQAPPSSSTPRTETATFSGGCFWSMNAIFERLKGVQTVTAGFSGGVIPNPSYETVCTGMTGHAETVQITFDPATISYRDLLHVFFAFHDPTTPNRQGADVGTQYRSVIFWHTPEQRNTATQTIADLKAKHVYASPIVTQVVPFKQFYPAEDYHQAYYDKNSELPYCRIVIAPKLDKLRKSYGDRLKTSM